MIFSKTSRLLLAAAVTISISCNQSAHTAPATDTSAAYLQDTTSGIKSGGIRMIPINTPHGRFNVWTKRIGNNPAIKVLLLNGGPGLTHEYLECFESFFPAAGIEFIYYDQLGCGNADNPKDTSLFDLNRSVEEVEQVRQALHLDKDNCYLLGHSWGGILAAQYALKYQDHLKGLIISDMMMSCPAYDQYAKDVLAKQLDPKVLARIQTLEAQKKFDDPEYMGLLLPHFYTKHILRRPLDQWPEPVNRSLSRINAAMYVAMQGPSEFGISGKLEKWDITRALPSLTVPTLFIGAQYDTMDPKHMEWASTQVQHGSYLYCPNGSHLCMWDDQNTYMAGVIKFIEGVNEGQQQVKL